MTHPRKSLCLVTRGMVEGNVRLQPWRYLHEVARQLQTRGYALKVISDGDGSGPEEDRVLGVPVRRVQSVSAPRWGRNSALECAIEQAAPDVVLWHTGLTSLVHQRPRVSRHLPVVGIFTSPLYSWRDLARLGPRRLARGYRLSMNHIAGVLTPRRLARHGVADSGFEGLIVQTQATRSQLVTLGLRPEDITVIAPGVDEAWTRLNADEAARTRQALSYGSGDTVVLYFGSPAPLRGLHTLIRAFEFARQTDASLKLLVLSRRRADELLHEDAELRGLLTGSAVREHVQVVSGYLAEDALVRHVAAADIVALPFELVPSDAPLSLLEARALGKPVVTTRIGCLPELVAEDGRYLAEPGDVRSLAQALIQAAKRSDGTEKYATTGGASRRHQARSWQEVGEEWSQLLAAL